MQAACYQLAAAAELVREPVASTRDLTVRLTLPPAAIDSHCRTTTMLGMESRRNAPQLLHADTIRSSISIILRRGGHLAQHRRLVFSSEIPRPVDDRFLLQLLASRLAGRHAGSLLRQLATHEPSITGAASLFAYARFVRVVVVLSSTASCQQEKAAKRQQPGTTRQHNVIVHMNRLLAGTE